MAARSLAAAILALGALFGPVGCTTHTSQVPGDWMFVPSKPPAAPPAAPAPSVVPAPAQDTPATPRP